MKKFTLTIFLFWGLIHYGAAIMCYECNSSTNSQCIEAILPDSLKRNCSAHDHGGNVRHSLCRKITQHIDHEVNGLKPRSRVIRTCGWVDSKYTRSCYYRNEYGGRQEVCSCVSDYCNSSTGLAAPPVIVSAVLLIQKLCRFI